MTTDTARDQAASQVPVLEPQRADQDRKVVKGAEPWWCR